MKLSFIQMKKIYYLEIKAARDTSKKKYLKAINYYEKIIRILPEPKKQWDEYVLVNMSMADAYFTSGDYYNAEKCYAEILYPLRKSAFILMMYGQTQYFLNNLELAEKYLKKAYELDGSDLFKFEDPLFLRMATKKV